MACSENNSNWPVLTGETMGTYYSVTYNPEDTRIVSKRLRDQIEVLLGNINQTMSTYIEDSELSLLNKVNMQISVTISDELFYVINHAQQISEQTNGSFDITIGPFVNLWGFGPDLINRSIPTPDEINFVKKNVGYEKLILDDDSSSVTKTVSDMYIDLSGIEKGYAVDQISQLLQQHNIENYLIDIGGALIAKGNNQQDELWQIGIEQANPLSRELQRIVSLNNLSMATSGDYRNYFTHKGKRYSYTIDATSGEPVSHNLASVTVLHENCISADALATAMLVKGEAASRQLAKENDIPIYMIIRSEDGFIEEYNDQFKQYMN